MIPGQLSLEGEGGLLCIRLAHRSLDTVSILQGRVFQDIVEDIWEHIPGIDILKQCLSRLVVPAPNMGQKRCLLHDQWIYQATEHGCCIIDSYVRSLAKGEGDISIVSNRLG